VETLILADDLTGAADCAAAAGAGAVVTLVWPPPADAPVVAFDLDSRRLRPAAAAARARRAVEAADGASLLYHKIDSLLRGNWPFELAELRARWGTVRPALTMICPAWPERSRSVRNGEVHVDGRALDSLTLTDDAGQPLGGDIQRRLQEVGVEAIRCAASDLGQISDVLAEARHSPGRAVIFDASSRAELDAIAEAALGFIERPLFVGSGGLMASLAVVSPGPAVPQQSKRSGPVLVVVGSASDISHAQVRALADTGVQIFDISPAGLTNEDALLTTQIERCLADGRHAAIVVDKRPAGSLRNSLVDRLAQIVASAVPLCGGLVLTGGETARAVLSSVGAAGIRILGEIEPGVPIGWTMGALALPVVTKAGAFGGPLTLLAALRALEAQVTIQHTIRSLGNPPP
jgi:uncharacterized protein YgbK (DUF1537 family)